MAEQERVRERERPPIADNVYERNMRQRKEFVERNKSGPIVIKRSDRELFQARQGKLLFYLCPNNIPDTPLQHWRVFIQEIRTSSGKHRHAGGLLIYVLDGHGYTGILGVPMVRWPPGYSGLLAATFWLFGNTESPCG